MISSPRPDLPALLAYLKRVEEARKLVAEFDEWLASAPPLPAIELPMQLTAGTSQIEWETTEDLAVRVVGILRHDRGPLRARDILTILQETGTSFISDNPVYSVVGALKVAREYGWVVKKGRGWWQAASRVAADSGGAAEGGDAVPRIGAGDSHGSHRWGGE